MKNNIKKTEKIKILRKTDIILIAAFVIFSFAFYFIFNSNSFFGNGDTVIIKLDGKIYKEIPLDEEKEVEIYSGDGSLLNIVRIEDKKAVMIYADCPDKRCMHGAFNGLLVCLPNRVTVEIAKNDESKDKRFDIII